MCLLTLDQAAVYMMSGKHPTFNVTNFPPVPLELLDTASAAESPSVRDFRFFKLVLANAADAGLLPCIKKPRRVAELRRIGEAIRRGNPDSALPEGFEKLAPIYDLWFALGDLMDFLARPDRLDSDSSESPWSHSRAALAKTLWLFIRLYVGVANEPALGDSPRSQTGCANPLRRRYRTWRPMASCRTSTA
jgi:hypothetical protein